MKTVDDLIKVLPEDKREAAKALLDGFLEAESEKARGAAGFDARKAERTAKELEKTQRELEQLKSEAAQSGDLGAKLKELEGQLAAKGKEVEALLPFRTEAEQAALKKAVLETVPLRNARELPWLLEQVPAKVERKDGKFVLSDDSKKALEAWAKDEKNAEALGNGAGDTWRPDPPDGIGGPRPQDGLRDEDRAVYETLPKAAQAALDRQLRQV
ncbi:MAG: hypothetical protein M5U09_13735 [Gammaproteobacteria bacterium]|nr:hypothetical protein [Gammaproteobacteria bacterium]